MSFLAAYLQEVGRAGRDGRQARAVLFYNSSDISPAVKSMADEMRTFCKMTSCRRKYLCEQFGCEMLHVDIQHTCCDNCAKVCSCDKCAEDMIDAGAHASAELEGLEDMLWQYFREENCTANSPTGLNASLMQKIIATYNEFDNAEQLSNSLP